MEIARFDRHDFEAVFCDSTFKKLVKLIVQELRIWYVGFRHPSTKAEKFKLLQIKLRSPTMDYDPYNKANCKGQR